MKLFLNTSDAQAHIRYAEMGVIDGIVLSSHAFGSHAQQLAGLRGLVACSA